MQSFSEENTLSTYHHVSVDIRSTAADLRESSTSSGKCSNTYTQIPEERQRKQNF